MATSDHIKALIRSFSEGDEERFFAIAMQMAAQAARQGHTKFAQELRDLVDQARGRLKDRLLASARDQCRSSNRGASLRASCQLRIPRHDSPRWPWTRLFAHAWNASSSNRDTAGEFRSTDSLRSASSCSSDHLVLAKP